MGCECANWIHLDQGWVQWLALVNTAMNFRGAWKVGNFFTRWLTIVLLRTLFRGVCLLSIRNSTRMLYSTSLLSHRPFSSINSWHNVHRIPVPVMLSKYVERTWLWNQLFLCMVTRLDGKDHQRFLLPPFY